MQSSSKMASRKFSKGEQDRQQPTATKSGAHQEVVAKFKKTAICRYYPKCSKGADCFYAHSESELKRRPNFTKTKMCAGFLDGRCKLRPEECRFAHGWNEVQSNEPVQASLPKYVDLPQYVDIGIAQQREAFAVPAPPSPPAMDKFLMLPEDVSQRFVSQSRFSSNMSSVDTSLSTAASTPRTEALAVGAALLQKLQEIEALTPSTTGDDSPLLQPLQVNFLQALPPAHVARERKPQARQFDAYDTYDAQPAAMPWAHFGLGYEATIIGRLSL